MASLPVIVRSGSAVRAGRVIPGLALAAALLAGCSGGKAESAKAPPLVVAERPRLHRFVDRVETVGTARADEQVTIASPVTERIERLYFDDGDVVRRGQVIAVLAHGQEQASLSAARAAEDEAVAQLARAQALSERGFATRATLDRQNAAARRARSDADSARAQIADRVIRAPFTGRVSLRNISAGAIVGVGAPIVTISDNRRIKLDFAVPETALAALHVGQPILATAAAFPDRPIRGHVSTIDAMVDPQTRAVTVRANLPNPGDMLKPGMLLSVAIEAAARQALAVPELAVIGEGDRRYVFVVGPGDKAVRRAVTTGLRDAGLIEVRGLDPGARVITEGVVKVADGMQVALAAPPPSTRP
ncbi:efflux RND transporter periplasmic adaptor subunit [Sphingomonas sp. VNH70]|uniref:efflux RND transporter periplasmic adaptor subunit n=1 Tax=Sphingomonas silueang TaxID=3156617 RepID=UPI0032B3DD3A